MTRIRRTLAITKELSANDTGETGGHQAGILIPKKEEILSFFPPLDASSKNPRHMLVFYDENGKKWKFAFIYYNNAYFGGTRNEYRLTRMTPFMRQRGLRAGDQVVLRHDPDTGRRYIAYQRAKPVKKTASGNLKLGGSWKIIKI